MLGLNNNFLYSTMLAVGLLASPAITLAQTSPQHPHNEFITTLKSLCKDNKYILLGDSDHTLTSIRELMADRGVLQAIKDCDRPLYLEQGIEENEGYKGPELPYNEASINLYISVVESHLAQQGYRNLGEQGIWDEPLIVAFSEYLTKEQERIGWDTSLALGFYSTELAEALIEKNPEDMSKRQFLFAAENLSKHAMLPVPQMTLRQVYQGFQEGFVEYTGTEFLSSANYDHSPDREKNDQSFHKLIFNAAQLNIPLLYPDVRYENMFLADEELSAAFSWVYEQMYLEEDKTPQGGVNFTIRTDALLNKNPEGRAGIVKLEKALDDSVSEEINQAIVQNIKKLNNNGPAIVMYGAGHMTQDYDFDEMLGADRTVNILLKGRTDQVVKSMPVDSKSVRDIVTDDPEYVYDIENRKISSIDKQNPNNVFRQMVRYGFTEQQYQKAVEQLSPDLKPYALPYTEYDDTAKNDQLPENWKETDKQYVTKPSGISDPEI